MKECVRETDERGDVTPCLLISDRARLASPAEIRAPAVTQVEGTAGELPWPIAACPNANMWADKDPCAAWKQRAAVGPRIDNSVTEKRTGRNRRDRGLNEIIAHHRVLCRLIGAIFCYQTPDRTSISLMLHLFGLSF